MFSFSGWREKHIQLNNDMNTLMDSYWHQLWDPENSIIDSVWVERQRVYDYMIEHSDMFTESEFSNWSRQLYHADSIYVRVRHKFKLQ